MATLDTTGIRDYLASLALQEAHAINVNPQDLSPEQAQARANDLRSLAERLQRLPVDDQRLVRLARIWYPEGLDGPSSGSAHANPVIRGYVADDKTDGLEALLDRIAELDEQERAG
ncbi:MAG: hypothetical protein WAL22_06345 [Solirubrobacteraceae bacterium]